MSSIRDQLREAVNGLPSRIGVPITYAHTGGETVSTYLVEKSDVKTQEMGDSALGATLIGSVSVAEVPAVSIDDVVTIEDDVLGTITYSVEGAQLKGTKHRWTLWLHRR